MQLFILYYNSQLIVPLLLQYVMSNAPQSRQPTPQLDALELQRQRFNSFQGAPSPQSSKQAMQQLYKQQLDSFLEVKAKQKQFELLRQKEERREFNERAEQGKEADRMKEVSYKNYYNMLMNNQSQHQQAYVSPFAKRENLKQSLINRAIEQERGRYQNVDMEVKRREAEKRSNYKNQLLQQIEDRRRKELSEKEHEVREKQHFTANTHNPNDIQRHERERHKDEVGKYREDLDMILERRNRVQSEKGVSLAAMRPEFHNVLTNPIPYNIQNPYILKEMGGQKNPSSYLATKGSQNLKIM